MNVVTIDFETEAIEKRPDFPPEPVGVAIRFADGVSKYYAWGHPTGNNCTKEDAVAKLRVAWDSGAKLLFHNAKFDIAVANERLGLPIPAWDRVEDTMLQLFLMDPHAQTYALKPCAEALLGIPPTERDAVRDWLVDQKIVTARDSKWGAHISKAPGDLVGTYAVGDVDRTYALWRHCSEEVHRTNQTAAYRRELELLPILLENEREGVRVDRERLVEDIEQYEASKRVAEEWLRRRLDAHDLNIDSGDELAKALRAAGVVTRFKLTATGKESVAKDSLTKDMFSDEQVFLALGYRNRLETCLGTFLRNWEEMSRRTGRIYSNWNQTRQVGGGSGNGARTGRLSSSPNFQNIPKAWEGKPDGYTHPTFMGVKPLPLIRSYVLPEEGGVILHRDYSQQELRILAHFEDAAMLEMLTDNPRLDLHVATAILLGLGESKEARTQAKGINFGLIYGLGAASMAESMGITLQEAQALRDLHKANLPGVQMVIRSLKNRARRGEPFTTWGGRNYYCERAKDGRTFEYKMLNYLIQGSAADCTKQALINYNKIKKHGKLMLNVHDEINISCPKEHASSEMKLLQEAMESIKFDVAMLSDGKIGPRWSELTKWEAE